MGKPVGGVMSATAAPASSPAATTGLPNIPKTTGAIQRERMAHLARELGASVILHLMSRFDNRPVETIVRPAARVRVNVSGGQRERIANIRKCDSRAMHLFP